MTRLPRVDFACHSSTDTKTFHEAKRALHKPTRLMLAALAVGFGLAVSCNQAAAQNAAKGSPDHIRAVTSAVDSASVKANSATSKDWPTIGLDYAETRFSKLNQINTDNVKNLGLVWSYSLDSSRGVEATARGTRCRCTRSTHRCAFTILARLRPLAAFDQWLQRLGRSDRVRARLGYGGR